MPRVVSLLTLGLMLCLSLEGGAWLAGPAVRGAEAPANDRWLVYVGTYTESESGGQGIYLLTMDRKTGRLSEPRLAVRATNPSFLAFHPRKRVLYAVSETRGTPERPGGRVTAFAVEGDGALTVMNEQTSEGPGPCFLTVDAAGANVLVANYSGSVAVLPLEADGRLKAPSAFVRHAGSSVHPQRQKGPHAHSINVDPGGRFALAADLGLDRVLIYRFDGRKGTLTPNEPGDARVEAGAGPRHLAFHPNGRVAYVISELASSVTTFSWDAARGALDTRQTLSTLPAGFTGTSYGADVQVHPSGRFVYGTNRGHDSVAAFAVDEASGALTSVGHESTGGQWPRHFGIDPAGSYLIAANQRSNSLVVLSIDERSGRLAPTGTRVEVPAPACVRFFKG